MPPVKAYWYEGLKKDAKNDASGGLHAAKGDDRNFPPLLREMLKQYPDEEIDKPDSGTLYVGEKGVMYTGTYGGKFHVFPLETSQGMAQPPRIIPRPTNLLMHFLDTLLHAHKATP